MRLLLAAAARSTNTRSFVDPYIRMGHEVHVATLHGGSIPGATVHDLGRAAETGLRFGFLRAVPRFRRLHRELRPDVTLGYYASSYGVLSAFAPPPRVVVTAGGDVLSDAQESMLRRFVVPRLAGWALRRAQLVLCWAPHLERAVLDRGVARERILCLPRGIDTATFHPEPNPPANRLRVVSTRRLSAFYRPGVLVDAVLAIRSRGIPLVLDLIGDGPDADGLRERVAATGDGPAVEFHGRLGPEDVAERLRAAQIYASFPPSDGVSASLLEAMGCGLLPVVSDIPSNRHWVRHEKNGLLVRDPADADEVVAALERAARDEALRSRARTENPSIVRERADRERNAVRFAAAFRSLTETVR